VEIEASDVEGPVAVVAVRGLEVAGAMEAGRVPEAAAEVGEQRQAGPQAVDLRDEERVVVDGAQGVVQRVLLPLDLPRRLVDALHAPSLASSSSSSPGFPGIHRSLLNLTCTKISSPTTQVMLERCLQCQVQATVSALHGCPKPSLHPTTRIKVGYPTTEHLRCREKPTARKS
jgi:hypothetical protein